MSEFIFAKLFLKEFILVNILFFVTVVLILSLSWKSSLLLFVIQFLFSWLLYFFIGQKRKKDISEISSLIALIMEKRKNAIEEKNLSPELFEIEKDLKTLFKKNQKDFANMRKLAKTRTEFLGNVSHELRTPIFSIQGFLETLLNGAIEDENVNRRFLKKAMNHTKNLNSLLNDLIDISMIETGEMRMQPTFFNIAELINSVTEEIENIAKEKGIKIIEKYNNPEIEVWGDRDKIKQVMVNLINNAIKYSDNGKIKVFTEVKKDKIEISVKDEGSGIPSESLNRIFERFYQVDKARSKVVGGTGLGLAIVKHIVEAHGSKISVKSKIGEGSVFTFFLKTQ
jgi:two-component system phosphate regulon sensor histidine kinase PhoR